MVCAWLMANAGTPAPPSVGFPILWAILPAVVVILIAAAVVAAVKRWRDREVVPERLSVSEQLSHFRSLYEEGELSDEEFAQIRTRLGAQLKQELEIPPGTGTGSTQPPPPTPDPDPNIRPGPPGAP